MTTEFKNALRSQETDIDGSLERFSGDEDLYEQCLSDFLEDQTMSQLGKAVTSKMWDDAFTAAHALKGVAGNLGLIPLFHECAEIVMLIRSGRIDDVAVSYETIKQTYAAVTKIIVVYGKHTAETL